MVRRHPFLCCLPFVDLKQCKLSIKNHEHTPKSTMKLVLSKV